MTATRRSSLATMTLSFSEAATPSRSARPNDSWSSTRRLYELLAVSKKSLAAASLGSETASVQFPFNAFPNTT